MAQSVPEAAAATSGKIGESSTDNGVFRVPQAVPVRAVANTLRISPSTRVEDRKFLQQINVVNVNTLVVSFIGNLWYLYILYVISLIYYHVILLKWHYQRT